MTLDPLAWLRSQWISQREVRAEVWALGGRHRGQVLEGARIEAGAPSISIRRSMLLRAVIRSQSTPRQPASRQRLLFGRRGHRL